jgi:hypothetical protein
LENGVLWVGIHVLTTYHAVGGSKRGVQKKDPFLGGKIGQKQGKKVSKLDQFLSKVGINPAFGYGKIEVRNVIFGVGFGIFGVESGYKSPLSLKEGSKIHVFWGISG